MENRVDTLIVGKPRIGKSTLFCCLNDIPIKINEVDDNIEVSDTQKLVGNAPTSHTFILNKSKNYIDLPGFTDQNGHLEKINCLYQYYSVVRELKPFKLAIVIPENEVPGNLLNEMRKFLDKIVTFFCISENNLSNISVIISKLSGEAEFNKKKKRMMSNINMENINENIILKGIKNGIVKVLPFYEPIMIENSLLS